METKPEERQLLKTDENINLVHFPLLNVDLVTHMMRHNVAKATVGVGSSILITLPRQDVRDVVV